MSQHSSCWLAKHQFFIKYCITEKETFKGEEKIEFSVLAQALMILAFYKVINWLYEGKQVVLHRALQIEFSLLLYIFPSLSTLIFPPPWSTAYMARRASWLHDKVHTIGPSLLPQQMPVLAAHMWQHGLEQGTALFCWNWIPTMHFTLAKGKKG